MSDLNRLDIEAAQKQLRRLLKSPEGRAVVQDTFGVRFQLESEVKDKPKVAILVPSHYQPKPETAAAMDAMLRAAREICVPILRPSVASSVVHWVRNHLITLFLRDQIPYDYILFMDDDIVPPQDSLVKLLNHKVDIVAAACTVRQDPPLPNFRIYEPETYSYKTAFEWEKDGLVDLKGGGVGTGMMLISRKAIEAIGDYYIKCEHEKRFLGMSPEKAEELSAQRRKKAEDTKDYWWFEFLKHPLGEGEYGEDISFCFKARELGIPVYVDTTIRPGHVGNYAYSLDDYIPYQKSLLAEETKKNEVLVVE